jgi:hypothetical protein
MSQTNEITNGNCSPESKISSISLEERLKDREERRKLAEINTTLSEEKVRPFPYIEVDFLVPEQTVKWLVNNRKIEELREQWQHQPWFPPDQSDELLVRQTAASLIFAMGKKLNA